VPEFFRTPGFRFAAFHSYFFPLGVDFARNHCLRCTCPFWSCGVRWGSEEAMGSLPREIPKKVYSENAEVIFSHYQGVATIASKVK
jgi:Zn-finger protein